MEPQILLPAWSKKRRLITLGVMTSFILVASFFIGMGVYEVGIEREWIQQPPGEERIVDELLNDADFYRAIRKSMASTVCQNRVLGFEYQYQEPFEEIHQDKEQKCTQLVALHETGTDVTVTVSKQPLSREVYVTKLVNEFDQVNTEMLAGTHYPTSHLSGIREGAQAEVYVMGIDNQQVYVIEFIPATPILSGKVLALAESFYSIPQ
jgi:hypothetical protein